MRKGIYNYTVIKDNIDKIIFESGTIPLLASTTKIKGFPRDSRCVNNYYVKTFNKTYDEYYRDMGYGYMGDVLVEGKRVVPSKLTKDDLMIILNEFIDKNKHFPRYADFGYNNNLPSRSTLKGILERCNMDDRTLYDLFNVYPSRDIENYSYWKDRLLKLTNLKGGKSLTSRELKLNKLPDYNWYIRNCGDKNILDYTDFVINELGCQIREMDIEEAASKIMAMSRELNRPLMYEDFRFKSLKNGEVTIKLVVRLWGSVNKMKEALGLEIIQENMVCKHMDYDEIVDTLLGTCDKILKTKNVVCRADITSNCSLTAQTIDKILRENGTSIREILESQNIKCQEAGRGLVHKFEDGELTLSRFEYEFTENLRSRKLIYGVDYHRDIRYSEFTSDYKGKMNCDYLINIGSKKVYIEIPGVLRDYKKNFINDTPIDVSKSKENYRLKLIEKKNLFRLNNIDGYFIFPSDFNKLDKILDDILSY